MKKFFMVAMLLVLSSPCLAGLDYYGGPGDEYDQETGLYYVHVTESEDGGFLKSSDSKTTDLYIYSPSQEKGSYLFNRKNIHRITNVAFESAFDEKEKAIVFNNASKYLVQNNMLTQARSPKDKILVTVYDESRSINTVWAASKSGSNLVKIKEYGKDTQWHIDVRNSKIRFITKTNKQVSIENVSW